MKAVTSIHCVTMKFPTTAGTSQVRGDNSREYYNKSLELVEKREKLPLKMEVEKTSKGLMETNIDPCLQEEESTAGPIEKLIVVQMDPSECSCAIKIDKGLKSELAQQLTEFLCQNQDMFAQTHADMLGIHPAIMCHRLNINPQVKPVRQK